VAFTRGAVRRRPGWCRSGRRVGSAAGSNRGSKIEAAKKRLHHDLLAIALGNKLARIAWEILNKEPNFEVTRTTAPSPQLA
jgi:hypothetical protein